MTPALGVSGTTTRRSLRKRRVGARRHRRFWAVTSTAALGVGLVVHVSGLVGVGPVNATVCTIAAAGDIAESGGAQAATAAIVKSLNPTAVLTLGDNAYPNGSSSDFAKYYEPTWGAFKAITKPAPGNHEYYTQGGTGYLNYFGVKPYYAYDLCGWRMYSLNRELSGAERSAEIAWYKSDLAANAGRRILAVWHEPRWTSGTKHGSDAGAQDLWAASVAGGVAVVLSGHEHSYERLGPMDSAGRPAAGGTREFVVGEGGNDGLSAFGTPLAASEKRVQGQQGVLAMTMRPDGYDFALHQVGGSVADEGSVSFVGTGRPAPTTTAPSAPTTAPSTSPTSSRPSAPGPSSGSSVVSAVEDATVTSGEATPVGSAGSLAVGRAPADATGKAGAEQRIYVKFPVTAVPAGATGVRASLTLTSAAAGSVAATLHRAADNWSESSLTWANQPGKKGTKIAGIAPLPAGQSRTVNVSSAVSGNGVHSFVLTGPSSAGLDRFASSESVTPPLLKVTWRGPGGPVVPTSPATPTGGPTTTTPGTGTPTGGPTFTPPVTGTGGTGSGAVAWRPPALSNPITVYLSANNHSLKLDSAKDYQLVMPRQVLDVGVSNLSINGGHNVVLIGGQLTGHGMNGSIRATNQFGTLHIEGLFISGANLQEGIQLQNEANAVVQLENIRYDTVLGSYSGHHADLVQFWGGGPKILRIDGLTGSTDYQAFMFQGAGDVTGWDFRRINIHHLGTAGWTMYDGGPRAAQITMSSIYFQGNDANGVWSLGHGGVRPGLSWGNPPGGDFVPAGRAGLAYGRS